MYNMNMYVHDIWCIHRLGSIIKPIPLDPLPNTSLVLLSSVLPFPISGPHLHPWVYQPLLLSRIIPGLCMSLSHGVVFLILELNLKRVSRYVPKRNEAMFAKRLPCKAALFSGSEVETAQVSISWWMDNKMWYIHTMEGYLATERMKFWHMLRHG